MVLWGGQQLLAVGSQGLEPGGLLMWLRDPRERTSRVGPASQTDPSWPPGARASPSEPQFLDLQSGDNGKWALEMQRQEALTWYWHPAGCRSCCSYYCCCCY